ncbi:hypothetical protein BDR05DRAFT_978282 [Suillus weaverae]|nr:hypothetical protein BDR05DRAFT_978282 [Suillus weaverae]
MNSHYLRPLVPTHERLHRWFAPHSDSFHTSILKELLLADVLKLFYVMLVLLWFHQYCDSQKIPEKNRMPTSDCLLASFVASWAAQNWLAGLHFWHNLHGAPWFSLTKTVLDLSKRPRRPPVTLEHMHALFRGLDLSNAFDAAVFATSCVAFWCCCRLGELIVDSINSFDPKKHIPHFTLVCRRSLPNQIPFIIFHIPWTKTTHSEGADIVASKVDDLTNPVTALEHHLSANTNVPLSALFFAYELAGGGWAPMTRPWLLARCNHIWRDAGLLELTGHCFRISGASELLLRGIPLDVVAMQGRWKLCAFLDYWRKIESILPLFVTASFTDACISMVHSSMDSFAHCYK